MAKKKSTLKPKAKNVQTNTEETAATNDLSVNTVQCPAGYVWDSDKKKCVLDV